MRLPGHSNGHHFLDYTGKKLTTQATTPATKGLFKVGNLYTPDAKDNLQGLDIGVPTLIYKTQSVLSNI